jgi:hypothetical protein
VRGIGIAAVVDWLSGSSSGRVAVWLGRRDVGGVLSPLLDLEVELSWLWRFLYGGRVGTGGAISKV